MEPVITFDEFCDWLPLGSDWGPIYKRHLSIEPDEVKTHREWRMDLFLVCNEIAGKLLRFGELLSNDDAWVIKERLAVGGLSDDDDRMGLGSIQLELDRIAWELEVDDEQARRIKDLLDKSGCVVEIHTTTHCDGANDE